MKKDNISEFVRCDDYIKEPILGPLHTLWLQWALDWIGAASLLKYHQMSLWYTIHSLGVPTHLYHGLPGERGQFYLWLGIGQGS